MVWESHLSLETLTGESRGLAKGEAARRVFAPALGEEKVPAAV